MLDKELIVSVVGDLENLDIEELRDDSLKELGFPNSASTTKCRTWPVLGPLDKDNGEIQ